MIFTIRDLRWSLALIEVVALALLRSFLNLRDLSYNFKFNSFVAQF